MCADIFRAAVEHAYTGTVLECRDADLLPLWILSDFLQMQELRSWCVTRLRSAMGRDAELHVLAWTAALARPNAELGDECAKVWLQFDHDNAPEPNKSIALAAALLRRVIEAGSYRQLVTEALVRVLRDGLKRGLPAEPQAAAAP